MAFRSALLASLLLAPPRAMAQHDEGREPTFEEALAHRSRTDLAAWKEAHPWSLGDRLSGFLGDLLAARRAGERDGIERAELGAAFLAEVIAEDPFSGWILDVCAWDAEACARQETLQETLQHVPGMIASDDGEAAWEQIADLRRKVAPPGGWPLCGPGLARCAAAYLHAGDRERARALAGEVASASETMRQGAVLSACERVLGELAFQERDLAGAQRRNRRTAEIAKGLDSGPASALVDGVESLEACEIDTLLEFAIGEKETLLVAAGTKGRDARLLPLGRSEIEERVGRLLAAFDAALAAELYRALLAPVESLLGERLGVVPDGILSSLPFEALASDAGGSDRPARYLAQDRAVVYLARAPLGATPSARAASPGKGWLVIEGASRSVALDRLGGTSSATVRSMRAGSADELASAAAGALRLHFDEPASLDPKKPVLSLRAAGGGMTSLDAGSLRSWSLHADLVVLANCRPAGTGEAGLALAELAGAFHRAGARDVVASLWNVAAEDQSLLAAFYGRLARGERVLDAMHAARCEIIQAGGPRGGPRSWAAWVLHRGS